MKLKTSVISTCFALCALAAAEWASAQSFLSGSTLQFAPAYPSSTTGANVAHTVGAGVEFSPRDSAGTTWALDVDDDTLSFTFERSTLWTVPAGWNAPFTPGSGEELQMNGLRMTDNDGSVPDFQSFEILSGTTLAGFGADRVRLTADTLLVDFAGLTSVTGDKVVLQLSPVPEASTWLLLAAGVVVSSVQVRRRRRAQARFAPA